MPEVSQRESEMMGAPPHQAPLQALGSKNCLATVPTTRLTRMGTMPTKPTTPINQSRRRGTPSPPTSTLPSLWPLCFLLLLLVSLLPLTTEAAQVTGNTAWLPKVDPSSHKGSGKNQSSLTGAKDKKPAPQPGTKNTVLVTKEQSQVLSSLASAWGLGRDGLSCLGVKAKSGELWACVNGSGIVCSGADVTEVNLPMRGASATGQPLQNLGQLTALTKLDLSGNKLNGAVPGELAQIPNLRLLDLSNNAFTGFNEIPSFPNLITLNVANNSFTGALPDFSMASGLQFLYLAKNKFDDNVGILASLMLPHLTLLDLSSNMLSGNLTDGINASIPNITVLVLHGNRITGPVPVSLGDLTNAQVLDLSSNDLTGGLPPTLSSLRSLQELNVSGNPELQGSLPPGLAGLNTLAELDFSGTNLACPDAPPNPVPGPLNDFCRNCPRNCEAPTPGGRGGGAPPPKGATPPPPVGGPPPPDTVTPPTEAPPPEGGSGSHSSVVLLAVLLPVLALVLLIPLSIAAWCCLRYRQQGSPGDPGPALKWFKYKELLAAVTAADQGQRDQDPLTKCLVGVLPSGELVTVKQVPGGKKELRKLASEAGMLCRCPHKSLQKLIGCCWDQDQEQGLLLVAAAVQGRGVPLDTLMRDDPGALTWHNRLHVAFDAALALDHLHSQLAQPVVHGAVVSANLLVLENNDAVLVNFGYSPSAQQASQYYPVMDILKGQDEQSWAEGRVSADVYSFGVILLELATNLPPVSPEGEEDIVTRVSRETSSLSGLEAVMPAHMQGGSPDRHSEPDDLSSTSSPESLADEGRRGGRVSLRLYEGLVALALACCNKDPGQRPSMRFVAERLEEFGAKKVRKELKLSVEGEGRDGDGADDGIIGRGEGDDVC